MKILIEKVINTKDYVGRVDIITGIEDFENEAEYDKDNRCYKVNNKIVPSVTQLLQDNTYDFVNTYILEKAIIRGKIIHKEIEEYLLNQEYCGEEKIGITKELFEFIKIYDENKELFNQKAIFEIKTTSVLNKKKTKKQCEMYAEGIKHLTNEKIDKFYAIWLPKGKAGKIKELIDIVV